MNQKTKKMSLKQDVHVHVPDSQFHSLESSRATT